MERAQVRNAADREQVQRAESRDRKGYRRRLAVLRSVLGSREGREFVWSELARHGLYESITAQSSMIYVMSGRRDAGLELMADVQRFPDLYLAMQREAMERAAADDRETDAAHTPRAEDGGSNG